MKNPKKQEQPAPMDGRGKADAEGAGAEPRTAEGRRSNRRSNRHIEIKIRGGLRVLTNQSLAGGGRVTLGEPGSGHPG